MRIVLTILISIVISVSNFTFGQQFDSVFGKPILFLKEKNPWLNVIGSDVPTFALYENGQIIYKKTHKRDYKYYIVKLSEKKLLRFISSVSKSSELFKLSNFIKASSATDQISNCVVLNIDSTKKICVYGCLNRIFGDRKQVPKSFLKVYNKTKNYRSCFSKKWIPDKIEIMFWDYNHAPNKRPWLKGFPDLNSPTTKKRGSDSYSIFIEKDKFEEFLTYYLSRGENEAVEINGRKMSFAYRFPYPNIK